MNEFISGYEEVASSCEHGNDAWVSYAIENFLLHEKLRNISQE
jgi:hypothetical protein